MAIRWATTNESSSGHTAPYGIARPPKELLGGLDDTEAALSEFFCSSTGHDNLRQNVAGALLACMRLRLSGLAVVDRSEEPLSFRGVLFGIEMDLRGHMADAYRPGDFDANERRMAVLEALPHAVDSVLVAYSTIDPQALSRHVPIQRGPVRPQ